MTSFFYVYERFLGKITDDMYLELTPQDTLQDLRQLLINAIPGFEFPRKKLDYVLNGQDAPEYMKENLTPTSTLQEVFSPENTSYFNADLTDEEINILALLMEEGWIDRQIASIEVTRMKYTGSDFKMTSQANHLAKLLSLKNEIRRMQFHMQRLYKRRKTDNDGYIKSNWSVLREVSTFDD